MYNIVKQKLSMGGGAFLVIIFLRIILKTCSSCQDNACSRPHAMLSIVVAPPYLRRDVADKINYKPIEMQCYWVILVVLIYFSCK